MKVASIAEARNHLSELLDRVKTGGTVLITDHGRPVARLEPVVSNSAGDLDGWLARLERQGILRRPTAPPPLKLLARKPPKPRKGADIVKVLLEERRQGR